MRHEATLIPNRFVRRRWRLSRQWVLSAIFAVTCCACAGNKQSPADQVQAAFDDVESSIQTLVPDTERRQQATELIDEMERNFMESAAAVDVRQEKFRRLSANYDASKVELEEALADVRKSMRENQRKLSDTNRRLSEILTATEWDAVQRQLSKALEEAIEATLS